jgi:hypothetical protein
MSMMVAGCLDRSALRKSAGLPDSGISIIRRAFGLERMHMRYTQ